MPDGSVSLNIPKKATVNQKNDLFDNKVMWLLTFTDIFSWGPYLITSSLAGIYLADKFGGDAAQMVGIGIAIYYVMRASLQIPLGYINDKIKKDLDEITFLLIGVLLMGLSFSLYPLISNPMHYYILQFVFGVGASFNLVSWRKVFAQNLDKGKEGLEYGIYETFMSIFTAVISFLAGWIANFGEGYFKAIFFGVGLITMLSGTFVYSLFKVKNRKSC